MFFYGESFKKGEPLGECSIIDVAKTVASVLGVPFDRDWKGENRSENK
jgi:hypothetical protein